MVKLVSSDKEEFDVAMEVVEQSVLLTKMAAGHGESDEAISLPEVTGRVLAKVIEYCEQHKSDQKLDADDRDDVPKSSEDILQWDKDFMKVDQDMLFGLLLASNYLDIKPLLDLGCKTVANMIRGKSAEEIREKFNITDEFTEEEQDLINKEKDWAEDN
ncbi:hypothetical protein IWQ57_006775 [Coemansia nantahalensis]|uniref:Uncharacterized protein n=1 Tax=Coemansia nantahalensis TaxID=2789366 RepID=A0ACC1JJ93_9FUNG|nr:hypothetical protein IWQ57_006775 [Coemansia nantahalensis]